MALWNMFCLQEKLTISDLRINIRTEMRTKKSDAFHSQIDPFVLIRGRNRTEYSTIRFGSVRLSRTEPSRIKLKNILSESNRTESRMSKNRIEPNRICFFHNRIESSRIQIGQFDLKSYISILCYCDCHL